MTIGSGGKERVSMFDARSFSHSLQQRRGMSVTFKQYQRTAQKSLMHIVRRYAGCDAIDVSCYHPATSLQAAQVCSKVFDEWRQHANSSRRIVSTLLGPASVLLFVNNLSHRKHYKSAPFKRAVS